MRESFWQKDSLITHILYELQPIIIFSPVANFGDQPQVVFLAVFDQFSGQFSKEGNSVGFKIFKILISGFLCFKSAQKIAPATVGQRFTQ